MNLQNVGISAWGLAIHQEARLIAVSANSANVDIFAPALTQYSKPSEEDLRQDGLIREHPYDREDFAYADVCYHTMKPGEEFVDPHQPALKSNDIW